MTDDRTPDNLYLLHKPESEADKESPVMVSVLDTILLMLLEAKHFYNDGKVPIVFCDEKGRYYKAETLSPTIDKRESDILIMDISPLYGDVDGV